MSYRAAFSGNDEIASEDAPRIGMRVRDGGAEKCFRDDDIFGAGGNVEWLEIDLLAAFTEPPAANASFHGLNENELTAVPCDIRRSRLELEQSRGTRNAVANFGSAFVDHRVKARFALATLGKPARDLMSCAAR